MRGSPLPVIGRKRSEANLKPTMQKPGGDGNKNLTAQRIANLPMKERARALLENPDYLEALQQRLVDGEAGALEVWLHRYGYGDPKVDKADEEEQKQEFERIRAEVTKVIQEGGHEGKVLDIAIQRSSRKLRRVSLPEPENAGD